MKQFDQQNLEQHIKGLEPAVDPHRDQQVLAQVLRRYRDGHASGRPFDKGRIMMFRKITKLSVAATILIVVSLIVYFLGDGFQGSNVAWARLVDHIYAVDTYAYRIRSEYTPEGMDQTVVTEAFATVSPLGYRTELFMNGVHSSTTYYVSSEGVSYNVIPALKRVQKFNMQAQNQEPKEGQGEQDPRFFVKLFMAGDYEELGVSEIDGIPVEGIRVAETPLVGHMFTECSGTLWVEQGTDWPYRLDIEGQFSQGKANMKMVFDQFQWDVPFEPELFEPNIPEDYTVVEETFEFTEQNLIQGLKLFHEVTGAYPSSMDMMTVITEYYKGLGERGVTGLVDMVSEKGQAAIKSISDASAFYAMLEQQQKAPIYFGDQIDPNDANAVLIQWTQEDGQIRVIYSDFRVDTMPAE